MYVIVGLGNPGNQYLETRHNAGFMVVDKLSTLYNIPLNKTKHKALVGEGIIQGKKVMLVKPQTFMNNSGESVREIVSYYKVELKDLIVIYDDVDLETGKIRVRPKGSAGTHNGMRSILYHITSEEFPRVRVGIGKPKDGRDIVAHVLGKFIDDEKDPLLSSIERAATAVAAIIRAGVDVAISRYNG